MQLRYSSYFVCPECKRNLSLNIKKKHQDTVVEGSFYCKKCDLLFNTTNEIPRFVQNIDKIKEHTAKSFGYKWSKFREIDEYYKKNFLDELEPLEYDTFFRNKIVLDAGTGIGIPCYCMAERGAKAVFAIDISDSIEIAHENNKKFGNVTAAKADIYNLPFKRETFDVVVCVAVLQHLPDHQWAFNELLSYVKSGGTLILWVYGREGNGIVKYFIEPFRKIVSRKLPLRVVIGFSYPLGVIFQLVAKLIYRPLNFLKINWLPLNDYILYRTNFDWKMNTQMIVDQLLAPLSHLFSKEEVEQFFKRSEFSNYILRHHNANSWTAIGTKS